VYAKGTITPLDEVSWRVMAEASSWSDAVSTSKTVASPAKAMDRRLAWTSKSRAILAAPATVDVAMAGGVSILDVWRDVESSGNQRRKGEGGGG
jgi:hypothetical protein